MLKKFSLLMMLTPLMLAAQQSVNYSNITPAAQTGYQNVTWQYINSSNTTTISAEIPNPVFISLYGFGAPSLTCSSAVNWTMFYTNLSTAPFTLYQCLTGLSGYSWYPVGGVGSGDISGLTSGYIPLAGSSTTLTGNSPVDFGVTTDGWLTASYPMQFPEIAVGTSTMPTLFRVTGQTIATLPAASSYPPITAGSVTSYWQTQVTDAASYANCTSGSGTTIMWCWSDGTVWRPGLSSSVTTVTASSPLSSSGGATPTIAIQVANTSQSGYLASADWNTFSSKQTGLNLLPGTYTDGDVCTYATSGTLLNCNIAMPTTLPPSGSAGGGLTGFYPNPTIASVPSSSLPAITGDCTSSAGTAALSCAHVLGSALTDGSSVAWNTLLNYNEKLTMAHNTSTRAVNLTNLASGQYYVLEAWQDSTGGALLTGGSGCTWYVGGANGYVASSNLITVGNEAAASGFNVLVFYYDGTNCVANVR